MNTMWLAWAAVPLYLAGFFARKRKIEPPFLLAGCLLQAAYLFARGAELGRVPLIGPHDTLILLAASLVGFSFLFHAAAREVASPFRGLVAAMAFLFSLVAMLFPPFKGMLPPVLSTYWFELHVGLSFFAYACFGVGAALGVVYLSRRETPVEKSQYGFILSGYLLFSVAMIAGGIWAYLAWGSYWLWTPKELWTSIVWLYYSLYLHLRLRPAWHGRKPAYAGVIGFILVLFTYLGVGLLMKSSHTF